MSVHFISDTHFSHRTLIKVRNLPEDKHDQILFNGINSRVKQKDVLIHAGDFSPRNSAQYIAKLITRINCQTIHFIKGNHDQKLEQAIQYYYDNFFEDDKEKQKGKKLTLKENDKISVSDENNNSYTFYIQHFPCISWSGSNRHVYHLHGHCHHKISKKLDEWMFPNNKNRNIMDIGVDTSYALFKEYRPFSLNDIVRYMNREI